MTHPRLFALELKKDITVAEKMGNASLNLSFRRLPRSGIDDEQYKNLVSITSNVLLPQMHDRWSWSLNASGDFTLNVRRIFAKEFVTSRGGTFESSEISFYLVQVGREEILFLTTSFKFGELVVGELVVGKLVGELVVGDLVGELVVGELIVGELMV
ncbi:hypothetical protein Tco_0551074 [Tanacetum coccineum]